MKTTRDYLKQWFTLSLLLTMLIGSAGMKAENTPAPTWTYNVDDGTLTTGAGETEIKLENVTASGTDLTIGENHSTTATELDLSGSVTGTVVNNSRSNPPPTTYTITSIGYKAFSGCTALESVTLPSTLNKIEGDAFKSTSLKTIKIPAGVTSIGISAFEGCTSLETVDLSDAAALTQIGQAAFKGTLSAPTEIKTEAASPIIQD